MAYADDLKHPKWQKKRLEIMQRDNFTCQMCGAKDKPLHVHHLVYKKGQKPWEYEDNSLITLCEECHCEEHRTHLLDNIHWARISGITNYELSMLITLITTDHNLLAREYRGTAEEEMFKRLVDWRSRNIDFYKDNDDTE